MTASDKCDALCCQCGNLIELSPYHGKSLAGFEVDGSPRELAERFCKVCKARTAHAYIRFEDWLPSMEERQYRLASNRMFQGSRLQDEIDRLRACEVRVMYMKHKRILFQGFKGLTAYANLIQYLDDGTFILELSDQAPAWIAVQVIDQTWEKLATNPQSLEWVTRSAKPDEPFDMPFRVATFFDGACDGPQWLPNSQFHTGHGRAGA